MTILRDDDKRLAPVLKIRSQISETAAAIEAIDDAPLPIEDVESRIDAWLESEQGGGLNLSIVAGLANPSARGGPGDNDAWRYSSEHPFILNLLRDLLRFHATLFPDQTRAALVNAARRHLESREPGLPLAERPAERKRLEGELRKLEVQEEKAISKIEADHDSIVIRRPDADPAIILEEVTR